MRWRKVTLLGVGLLGGSLGLALRKRVLAGEVHGYVRRKESVAECVRVGAVDTADTDLIKAVRGADLLVLCTPLAQMESLSRAMVDAIEPGTLVTDVGSVKAELVAKLEPLFASRNAVFVGSHPMAGSEKMGVSAATADLFQNAMCVITPSENISDEYCSRTEELWRDVGARTMRLSPEVHDELVARSSHLPHVLAAHLARYVLDPTRRPEQSQLCAGGFRDCTRIASGSPEMWRDIVMMNRAQLKRAVGEYANQLQEFETLIDRGDIDGIERLFMRAKQLRDSWSVSGASQSPE